MHTALLGVLEETRCDDRGCDDDNDCFIRLYESVQLCIPHKFLLRKVRKLGIDEGPIRGISFYTEGYRFTLDTDR